LRSTINATLATKGLMCKVGTMVDANLIAAPSSTKNSSGERDPDMHQTEKGNQWHFGMKAHIGVDADSGFVHTVIGTAANVNDVTQGHGPIGHAVCLEQFKDGQKANSSRGAGMSALAIWAGAHHRPERAGKRRHYAH
jgi:IS5 family transposase